MSACRPTREATEADLVVEANAEGTKLKSYTKETGFVGWVGVGYEFGF